ncbi:MAG: glycosyltransferase [Gemmatimonadaceae bacterium]|nr:glycosyltransferase [Gemmatimonadaceae bacterium]
MPWRPNWASRSPRAGTRCTSSPTSSRSGCPASCRASSSTRSRSASYPLFEFPPYDLALAVKMHEVVRDHGLDVLHCHYAIPHATSAWIAREMLRESGQDVRVVTTLHGTDITIVGQDRSFFTITKFSIEKSDRITAVSEYLQRETVKAFGCTGCAVEVIHNFIDPAALRPCEYSDRPVPDGGCARAASVLMHISNFRAVKRVRDVVRIFAKVRDAGAERCW